MCNTCYNNAQNIPPVELKEGRINLGGRKQGKLTINYRNADNKAIAEAQCAGLKLVNPAGYEACVNSALVNLAATEQQKKSLFEQILGGISGAGGISGIFGFGKGQPVQNNYPPPTPEKDYTWVWVTGAIVLVAGTAFLIVKANKPKVVA